MGNAYVWKTLDKRVQQIMELHISAEYRLSMLERLQNAVQAYKRGISRRKNCSISRLDSSSYPSAVAQEGMYGHQAARNLKREKDE